MSMQDHTPYLVNRNPPIVTEYFLSNSGDDAEPDERHMHDSWSGSIKAYIDACHQHEPLEAESNYPWVTWKGPIACVHVPWFEGMYSTAICVLEALPPGVGALLASPWRTHSTQPSWDMLVPLSRAVEPDEIDAFLRGIGSVFAAKKVPAPTAMVNVDTQDGQTVRWTCRQWAPYREGTHYAHRTYSKVEHRDGEPLDVDSLVLLGGSAVDTSGATLQGEMLVITEDGTYSLAEIAKNQDIGWEARAKCPVYNGVENKIGCCRVTRTAQGVTVACFGGKGEHQHPDSRPTRTGGRISVWRWVSPHPEHGGAWPHLQRSERGGVVKSLGNAVVMLEHDPSWINKIRYDEMEDRIYVGEKAMNDALISEMRVDLGTSYGYEPGAETMMAAVQVVATRNTRNSLQDYLRGLVWDGRQRVETFLSVYLGVGDSALHRAYSRCFLVGAVARALTPGCKHDLVLTLVGPQGVGKSRALRALAGDRWFLDSDVDIGSKEGPVTIQGKWIVEFGEFHNVRKSTIEATKAFLSRQVDSYRAPYGRCVVDRPRRCAFVASTNEGVPLVDPTGNRRFMPVAVGDIDVGAIEGMRNQLWAEAAVLFRHGVPWHLTEDESCLQASELRLTYTVEDTTADSILEWADEQACPFSLSDAIRGSLDIKKGETRRYERVAANALRRAGYTRDQAQSRVEGQRVRLWRHSRMTSMARVPSEPPMVILEDILAEA